MSNIMSMLFSFVLIFPTILFGADLYALSSLKIKLEARATALSYEISLAGGVRQQLVDELLFEGITLSCISDCAFISVGQTLKYELSTMYAPIIFSKDEMKISVIRTTIVGYL